jgi:hypothetical protein
MAKAEATTKRVELGQVVEGKGRVWLSRRSVITTPRGISYDGCGGGVSKVPAKVRWVKQQENEAAACVGCQHPLFPSILVTDIAAPLSAWKNGFRAYRRAGGCPEAYRECLFPSATIGISRRQ